MMLPRRPSPQHWFSHPQINLSMQTTCKRGTGTLVPPRGALREFSRSRQKIGHRQIQFRAGNQPAPYRLCSTANGPPPTSATGQRTKSLCDRGSLSACVLTRLEIADSGAWRPVLRIEVLSTSSKTGVSHEYGYRQPAASAHDRGHERAQALCGDTERPPAGLPAVRGVSQAIP